MSTSPIPASFRRDWFSIGKRDADCYDIYDGKTRIAALRSDFTTDPATGARTMKPGTWVIRWEFEDEERRRIRVSEAVEGLTFQTVHDAFAFFCSQVLE